MFKFWGFSKQRWVFGEIVFKLRKCAEISNFAVECDRNSKISQNVPKSIFIEKLDDVFQKKHEHFNIAKDSKFAVECDRNNKSSRNVQNLIFIKKVDEFFQKKTWSFENR